MIIAISAGQYYSNKGADFLRKKHLYLNMGLLGLSTLIKEKGYDVFMIQGNYDTPLETIKRIRALVPFNMVQTILLSIPSYYSLDWSIDFCELIKSESNIRIVVGGRWVINNDPAWLQSRLKNVDLIADGFGESIIDIMINHNVGGYINGEEVNSVFRRLDYSILDNYVEYNPSIEISRGCGSGCEFCLDRRSKRLFNKRVDFILDEIETIKRIYSSTPNFYFESPHFVFEEKWINDLIKEIHKENIKWRCTTRVETIPLKFLDSLAQSGLAVLDVGVESASPRQLLSMGKTNNPERYLYKADELLKACSKLGIKTKLNMLYYVGESFNTIKETESWIKERADMIDGISIASLIYYRNSGSLSALINKGGIVNNTEDVDKNGFVNLDLSKDISHVYALSRGRDLSRYVMDQKKYFYLKSFSYFPRSYDYSDFERDIDTMNDQDLPFRREGRLCN